MKIAFFDSGIGGLSVLHEALHVLPNEQFLYFSDGKNIPYGTKSREEVRDLVFAAFDFLAKKRLKAAVVACNTATSVCIEELRARHSFPIIGMEPAVKPALAEAAGKRVLVFATELTLRLEKFHSLVQRIDNEGLVDYLPLQKLVALAEQFEFSDAAVLPYLREKLGGVNWGQYGCVVLGCTHFPFFKKQFQQLVPASVGMVDGNLGTVQQLLRKLEGRLAEVPAGAPRVAYFLSGEARAAAEFERYFSLLNS